MIYILSCLAVWRLARMVVYETGPFMIFDAIRYQVSKRTQPGGWVEQGFNCPLCIGFWFSLFFAIMIGPADFFITWFGIAGGAAALHLFLERD